MWLEYLLSGEVVLRSERVDMLNLGEEMCFGVVFVKIRAKSWTGFTFLWFFGGFRYAIEIQTGL